MTPDEYIFLKKWMEIHPKKQSASPYPATDVMQKLIDAGFLLPIIRPDASNSEVGVVIGYEITIAGEDALKQHQDNGKVTKEF